MPPRDLTLNLKWKNNHAKICRKIIKKRKCKGTDSQDEIIYRVKKQTVGP